MALKGAGVWALIAQYLTNTIIDTLFLFLTVRWHPRLMFSWKRAKPLIAYGSKVMMTDLIGTIFNNLGDFIVGLRYTTADLAYYTKGKQLPMLLKTNISTALISVLFPGMSQVNDENEKVKILSRQSVRMLSYIIFPLMAGMMVVARPLTIVLYTGKWIAMVPFVWVVCLEAVISVPGTVALQCVKAVGRSDMMLYSEFIKKPIFLISICGTSFRDHGSGTDAAGQCADRACDQQLYDRENDPLSHRRDPGGCVSCIYTVSSHGSCCLWYFPAVLAQSCAGAFRAGYCRWNLLYSAVMDFT